MKKEFIDVLDRFGNSVGITKSKEDIHKDGDFHRVIHLWIYHPEKGLLLQKRSLEKENHPGCWDMSCGGHVMSFETSLEALNRELKEELGISIPKNKIKHVSTFKRFRNNLNKEIVDLYFAKENLDIKKLKFIDKEVIDAKYVPIPLIKKFIDENPKDFIIREDYPIIFHEIESIL